MSDWTYDPDTMNTTSDGNPSGNFEQQVIERDHLLYMPIMRLVQHKAELPSYHLPPGVLYLVTESRWTGYSSYTITNQWDEVHIHVGLYDLHYDGMGTFLAELARVN